MMMKLQCIITEPPTGVCCTVRLQEVTGADGSRVDARNVSGIVTEMTDENDDDDDDYEIWEKNRMCIGISRNPRHTTRGNHPTRSQQKTVPFEKSGVH
jgi:hypothetical protein